MLTTKEAIEKRRSIRKFKPDPISDENLFEILEAARLAPSGCNAQPWRFKIVKDVATKSKLAEAAYKQSFVAMRFKLICCLLITILIHSSTYAEQPVAIATGEFPPRYSSELKHNGIMLRIVTEAFAFSGIETVYAFYPWKRAILMTKAGEADATALWGYKEDRTKYFYHSDPVYNGAWVFFHLKDTPFNWNTFDDLKGMRVGGIRGYTYGKSFYEMEKKGKFVVLWVSSEKQILNLLKIGRINIAPGQADNFYFIANKLFGSQGADMFTYHHKPFHSYNLHLLFSKKVERNKRLLKIFNKGLKHLRKSGKHHQFLVDDVKRGVYVK